MKEDQLLLRPGDFVEVCSPKHILSTLDMNNTLDGLPFMPEMLAYCGQRFQVLRRAEKICVDAPPFGTREFQHNDVVLLEGLRCSGQYHGGCQKLCRLFWKQAWLKKVAGSEGPGPIDREETEHVRPKLKTEAATGRYFCQSTELIRATNGLSRWQRIAKCWRDYHLGSFSLRKTLGWLIGPMIHRIRHRLMGHNPKGSQTRTPADTLNLQPGETVEVKSLAEIIATLDHRGKNRGLEFATDMRLYCGRQFRVKSRIERMILEGNGRMRDLKNTVILEEITCACPHMLGGCSRSEYHFWREIWLKRVEPKTGP